MNTPAPVFAEGLHVYKLFWVFVVGCFLGVVVEMIWHLLRFRNIESRRGLIYGPFNPVYGVGALTMTCTLYHLRDGRDVYIFLLGTLVGGACEYLCSLVQEKFFGSLSWDYRGAPLNLHGRINLLYCFFWGILGLIWIRDLYPVLSSAIERIPREAGILLTWAGIVFFAVDIVVSALAVCRAGRRARGERQAKSRLELFLDRHYPDERIRRIYPNMEFKVT